MAGDVGAAEVTEVHLVEPLAHLKSKNLRMLGSSTPSTQAEAEQEPRHSVIRAEEDQETGVTIIRTPWGDKKIKFQEIDPQDPQKAISQNLYTAATELLPLTFSLTPGLKEALLNYTRPDSGNMDKDEIVAVMKKGLEDYVALSKKSPEFQVIMNILRNHLPEKLYVYRGQVGTYPHRQIENYSVNPDHTYDFIKDWRKMGDVYHEKSMIIRKEISRDQVIAIGTSFQGEVIVDNGAEAPAQPLNLAA